MFCVAGVVVVYSLKRVSSDLWQMSRPDAES